MKKNCLSVLLVLLAMILLLSTAYADGEPITVYNYRAEDGMGTYTLPENLTVGANEQLLADTLTIPANVTLTVNGSATVNNALVIEEGGALVIGAGARFELNNFKAPPTSSVFYGTITLSDDARMYMGLGHWTNTSNTSIKNAITVAGQNALIQVDYHHSGGSPKTVNEMLNVITGADAAVPSELEPFVRKVFSLCIPYEATTGLTIPEGIQFRVLNNGNDETGSLTIPQGAVLTIPEGVTLQLSGADLTVNGTVENNCRIDLMTYNGGPEGMMPTFTLGEAADYQGDGQIWVRSYGNNPLACLTGFDPNKLTQYYADDMGAQFCYVDKNAVFAAFQEACDPNNHPDGYDLSNLGEFTLLDNVTIPQGMHVDAWGTTIMIPENVTLLVNGGLSGQSVDVSAGGTLRVEGANDSAWAYADFNEALCGDTTGGAIQVGEYANFNLDFYGWNEAVANHLAVSDNGDVCLNFHVNSDGDYQDAFGAIQNFHSYGMSLRMNMNINCPIVLSDGDRINPLFQYHVHRNEYSNGSLTVPTGATVTMTVDSYVEFNGAELIVNGTLINNGSVFFRPGDNQSSPAFVLAAGAEYEGSGRLIVQNTQEDPDAVFTLADPYCLEEKWSNDYDTGYIIYNSAPATADSISCTGLIDLDGTNIYMHVIMSVTTATAETDCFWGIQYSTDPTFAEFDIWGHNPVMSCTNFTTDADLTGLVPNVTYYYRAVLFHETENGWEVFVQESGEPHSFTLDGENLDSLPVITLDPSAGTGMATVAPSVHMVYRFTAPADDLYVVTGTGLDYTILVGPDGNRMHSVPQNYWRNTANEACQRTAFFASAGEDWFFSVGSYDNPDASRTLLVSRAATDPATTVLTLSPATSVSSGLGFCFTAETAGFYRIAIDHPEFGGMAYHVGGNSWTHTGEYGVELAAGESIFFFLDFDEAQAAATAAGGMVVTVEQSSGLAELMQNAAGNPDESCHIVICGGTLRNDLTIPFNVSLHVRGPWTLANNVTLNNFGDIILEYGGSLTLAEGGMLELQDASDGDWVAQIVLSGGSMDVTGGSVTYGEGSRVTIDCGYYGNNPEEFLGSVAGISADRIDLNVNVSTADEVFGPNGDAGLWNELSGYSGVTFNLGENLNLPLPVSEIPGEYMLILNYGTAVSIPEGNTLDLNGGLVLEGGAIVNNGTLNVNNWINFQRSDSRFTNNGTILVSGNGWIGANSFHEGHGSGAIENNGLINVLDGGVIMPQVHVINNPAYILVRLELPGDVTEIGEEAFAGTDIQAIDLPENIQQIGARAFADCEKLRVVVIPSADVTIDPTAFEGCGDITIIAPAGGTVQAFAEACNYYFVPKETDPGSSVG